jgi:hypothetical protein
VDFLFHRGGRYDLADAKWTEHPEARQADNLRRVAKELPADKVDRCAVVCRADQGYPVSPSVVAMPLHELPDDWS